MHLHSTYKLAADRWVQLGNSKEELFEEAGVFMLGQAE